MNGLNRLYLIGLVGQDPELRATANGGSVIKVSVATPHSVKDGNKWVDKPDWHQITAFGKDAEFLSRNATKGSTLAVECAVRPNKYTDKNGEVRYTINFIIDRILWVQRKGEANVANETSNARRYGNDGITALPGENPDGDIPF